MKIIISPAKKMNIDTETIGCQNKPPFLEKTGSSDGVAENSLPTKK